ncbi:MAG: hypothetical protein ACIARR_12570 [Phycisphaerales bacterium JB059]
MQLLRSVSARLTMGALALATLSGNALAESPGSMPKKPIFDATRFIDGPTVDEGEKVRIPDTYPVRFVPGFLIHLPNNRTTVSRETVRATVKDWANEPPALTVLDIEHLPVETVRRGSGRSIGAIRRNQNILSNVVDSIREEAPGLRLGFFDLLPPQHMHAWRNTHHLHGPFSRSFEKAFKYVDPTTNNRNEYGFVDRLDFLAPAVYIHESRIQRYLRDKAEGIPLDRNVGVRMIRDWIRDTVAAAREAQKPVYPVIWHRMHGGRAPDENGFETREYIGDELLRIVLEASLEFGDGVILWSDGEQYNEDDPWFEVIAEFTERPVTTVSFDQDNPWHRTADATTGPSNE